MYCTFNPNRIECIVHLTPDPNLGGHAAPDQLPNMRRQIYLKEFLRLVFNPVIKIVRSVFK